MKKYTLSIPEPCSAPLQDMPRTEMGRYCDQCQKQVVDFTGMTDRQMIAYFEQHGNCCGMVQLSQLDREIVVGTRYNKWMPAAIFAGMLALILPETGKAQQRQGNSVVKDSAGGNSRAIAGLDSTIHPAPVKSQDLLKESAYADVSDLLSGKAGGITVVRHENLWQRMKRKLFK